MSKANWRNAPQRHALLFGSCLLLGLTACATRPAGSAAPTNILASDWQPHARPLFNQGPSVGIGTNKWRVPGILPKGTYRLINHAGDNAEIIDGYVLEIDGNPAKEILMMLPMQYSNVEVIDVKYVLPR